MCKFSEKGTFANPSSTTDSGGAGSAYHVDEIGLRTQASCKLNRVNRGIIE